MDPLMLKIALVISAFLAAAGAKYIFHLPPDNPIEQAAETIVVQEAASVVKDIVNSEEDVSHLL